MFDSLLESRPRRFQGFVQTIVSGLVHGGLVLGALLVSRGAAGTPAPRLIETTMVFSPPAQPMVRPAPSSATVSASAPTAEVESVMPPMLVPTTIPPIALGNGFDPAAIIQRTSATTLATIGNEVPGSEEFFVAAQVDQVVQPLDRPELRYPRVLEAARVEGRVELRFIVDTLGQVEPHSVAVITSGHPLFEASALKALHGATFLPARVGGRPVRQLVQQVMVFRVKRL